MRRVGSARALAAAAADSASARARRAPRRRSAFGKSRQRRSQRSSLTTYILILVATLVWVATILFTELLQADPCECRICRQMTYADIHFHILPGVDDGPSSMDESVAL